MNEEKTEKKSKKRLVAVLLIALLLIGAGLTAAYFTDHKAVMNEFTVGGVKTELTEPKWETDENGKQAAQQLRPNMTFIKDPQIKNVGKSDSYNFIMFAVPYGYFNALGRFEDIPVTIGDLSKIPYLEDLGIPQPPPGEGIITTVKKGQCTDFNTNIELHEPIRAESKDYVGPFLPINTYFKDLFQFDVNEDNWKLIATVADPKIATKLKAQEEKDNRDLPTEPDPQKPEVLREYFSGYQIYIYAYATGKDAVEGKLTPLKPGETTKPLFKNEKMRVINLIEDSRMPDYLRYYGIEGSPGFLPVISFSIQTTDLFFTDKGKDSGKDIVIEEPFTGFLLTFMQLYQEINTDKNVPDWAKPVFDEFGLKAGVQYNEITKDK